MTRQCRTYQLPLPPPRELELINSLLTVFTDGCVTVCYSLTSQIHQAQCRSLRIHTALCAIMKSICAVIDWV